MESFDVDLFTIGGGSAGVRASRMAAQAGARVALCEENQIGGTCVLRGCVPKKLLVYAAQYAADFADAAGFGWQLAPPRLDWQQLMEAKERELVRLTGLYRSGLQQAGVELISGRGSLVAPHTVEVEGKRYRARHILVATGGRPYRPSLPGIEHSITSNEALELRQLPRRMVIVGGGYIAVELAGIFNAVGVEVVQILRAAQILRGFDADLCQRLTEEMSKRGVRILAQTQVEAIQPQGSAYQVELDNGMVMETDCVLYATGRRPLTADLGLEHLGVALSAQGAILVDEGYRSSVAGIYALGDVTGRLCLTPVALAEAMVLVRRLFKDEPHAVLDYRHIPTAVFSQPPLATVGLSEAEVDLQQVDVYVSSFRSMKHTLSGRDERSFLKLLVDRASNRVLGAHMLGADAPEIMQGLAVAMVCGATKAQFDATVGIHPTAAEEFVTMRSKRS